MRKRIVAVYLSLVLSGIAVAQATIGISLSDLEYARWPRERDAMVEILKRSGFDVVVEVADSDERLQARQLRSLAESGAKVIIVVAEEGESLVRVVDELAEKGVRVIAYDRLIPTRSLAAYVSFDLVEIGRLQARGVLAAMDAESPGDIVLLGGSPTNRPQSQLFRKGQLKAIRPLMDMGRLRIVADRWIEFWDPADAEKQMRAIIQRTRGRFDAVVASNDGTALGAIRAMKAEGLAGKVPISGQDATEAGCNSIARGELTVTILKDDRLLSPVVCDIAVKSARGETVPDLVPFKLSDLLLDESKVGEVRCRFLPLVLVTRDNLKSAVVDSGYQDYDAVYAGVENPPPR